MGTGGEAGWLFIIISMEGPDVDPFSSVTV
jgi:hypothetical protein